ncbi:MAG: hypothetical protein ACI9HU_001203, partial [Colwellia sp.]
MPKGVGNSHRHLASIEDILRLFERQAHKKTVAWKDQC